MSFAFDSIYSSALAFVVVFALVSFPVLFFVTAPYGRHARPGFGPAMPVRLAWVIMETPSPLCFGLAFFSAGVPGRLLPWLFCGLWMLHYVHRSFVFPLRMRADGKTKPVLTVALAMLFNSCNGFINGYALVALSPHLSEAWLYDIRFALGLCLFFAGYAINRHSDVILRNLRAPGEGGYRVPEGFLYRYVSCPNYLGEIVEWLGFALASFTPAAAAFALFTLANLLPRAVANHRWYQARFEAYPPARRALIPFIL